MSPNLIKKLGPYEHADSVTWDPHKALVVPLQATFFVTKHEGMMMECNQISAECLFHKERASYSCSLDVGDKSMQCSRVIDILKIWTYFKGNGWEGVAKQVEQEHNLALYCRDYVLARPERFELVIKAVDTFNVCFWYIPKEMKRENYESEDKYYSFLSKLTVLAKKYMIDEGKMLVGYSKSRTNYYFWRTVMNNPFIENKHVDYEMDLIGKYT